MNTFKEKVLEKKEKQGILAYFKDSIRIPEISVLLMLVDDSVKNPRKKRETLLNPNYKFIGISASDVNSNQDDKDKNKKAENGENVGEHNSNNENNNINKEGKTDTNDINKLIRNEAKLKPFCAYFTLK